MGDEGGRVLVEAARHSLAVYLGLVHRTVEGKAAVPPRHLAERVIPAIEDASHGNTLVVAPPGSAKTMSLIGGVGWWLGQNPTLHTAFVSNTATQAIKRSQAIRDTIAGNPNYRTIFPTVEPDYGKGWAEAEWYVRRPDVGDKDPSMVATGVGGALLGSRIDLGILDDIADPENMRTELLRGKVRDWLQDTFMTRMAPSGRVIMICTRWHEQDPAAWAIEQGWHVVHIDALTPDGGSYWPEYWPLDKLACPPTEEHPEGNHWRYGRGFCWREELPDGQVRMGQCKLRSLGVRKFAQQYRGVVVDDSSALIKRHYWGEFRELPLAASLGGIFVDTAHTESSHADYSVVMVVMTDGVNFYVMDVKRAQVEFPVLERMVTATWEKWRLPIYIEDTLGGKPLWQRLKKQLPAVLPWKIGGRSKLARVEASLPYFEGGNVFLKAGAGWAEALIEEAASFPSGAHDDQVDALTMALLHFARPAVRWGAA